MSFLLSHLNYVAVVVLMMAGLFVVFSSRNLIKRMVGLALFQTSTGLFYISLGKVTGGTAAITIDAKSAAGQALAGQLDPAYVAEHGVKFEYSCDPKLTVDQLRAQGFEYVLDILEDACDGLLTSLTPDN